MSAQFMRRNIRISVRLTEEEHRLLKEKMARIGVTNQEAFLRKMALDGLVIRLDLPALRLPKMPMWIRSAAGVVFNDMVGSPLHI